MSKSYKGYVIRILASAIKGRFEFRCETGGVLMAIGTAKGAAEALEKPTAQLTFLHNL